MRNVAVMFSVVVMVHMSTSRVLKHDMGVHCACESTQRVIELPVTNYDGVQEKEILEQHNCILKVHSSRHSKESWMKVTECCCQATYTLMEIESEREFSFYNYIPRNGCKLVPCAY